MTQRVVNYTYSTGNPVLPNGSTDVRDGIDNLQSMDVFMNATEDTYNQRDGEIVRTVAGMNNEFDAHILNMGFARIGTFASGATLTNPRQTLLWDVADGGDGQEYGWSGEFPKVVPATSTPTSTGGISVGAWISRFDPELRIQVREALRRSYAEAGYNLVDGSFEAGGVLVNANDVLLHEASGRAFTGAAGTVSAGTNPASGGFTDVSGSVGEIIIRSTADLLSAVLSAPATLNIKADLLITSSITLPRDITLRFSGAGKLSPTSGVAVVIDSYIDTGPSHILNMSQGGLFIAGNSFRQFVHPEWFGAVGLVGVDDTVPLQTALDFCDSPSLQKLRMVLSAKSYSFTNLLLEDQAYIVGKGLWNSLLKRLPGSTGVGITERTSATKISLVGFVLDCSGVSEVGLRLGFNGIQWGNEAIIDDFGIRDSGTARCAEINGNVGQIKTMLVQTTGTSGNLMYLDGGANKIDTLIVVSTGVSPVGIEIRAGSTVIDKLHTEGKITNPCLLTGADNLIKSMSFSAGASHAVDDVVKLTGASSIRNIIDDVFVIKPASSTITNNVNDTTNGTTWEFNSAWPHFRYAQGGQKRFVSQMGTATFASSTSVTVTFARTEPNTGYRVALCPLANQTMWVTNKTINGFTLNTATAGSNAPCDYTIMR